MNGSTTLLVDDDPAIRGFLALTLEVEGFTVVTAPDGAEGLRLAQAEAPAAVRLDLMMPGLSGWDLPQQWRDDAAYQLASVIVESASGQDINAAELGVQAVFARPFDLDRLIGKLTQLPA